MKHLRIMETLASALLFLTVTACGGNNDKEIPGNNTPTLTLSPPTRDVVLGKSVTFTVTATNTDFNVSGNGCTKSNTTTVVCTPVTVGTHELTVTATADTTLTRKATITVVEVDIKLASESGEEAVEVTVGEAVAFTVTTANTDDFTMNVDDEAGCVRNDHKITCIPTATGTYTLTVIATADTSKTATATITATPAGPEVIEGMVFVEVWNDKYADGTTFMMGCTVGEDGATSSNCSSAARPKHPVILTQDFYIGKYEVTQKQWQSVLDEIAGGDAILEDVLDNQAFPNNAENPDRPVTNVSWDEAQHFITRLNEQTGKNYRLPTEAEWEYAARGGAESHGYMFSGSNGGSSNVPDDVAWFSTNSSNMTHTVGLKIHNELGIYDMSGNAREWVADFYSPGYSAESQTDPLGPDTDDRGNLTRRVTRGGAYNDAMSNSRVWWRGFTGNTSASAYIGFRLALTAD